MAKYIAVVYRKTTTQTCGVLVCGREWAIGGYAIGEAKNSYLIEEAVELWNSSHVYQYYLVEFEYGD